MLFLRSFAERNGIFCHVFVTMCNNQFLVMKKFFRTVMAFCLAGGMLAFTGCTDYEDDINKLDDRLTAVEGTIADLKSSIEDGAVITGVQKTETGVNALNELLREMVNPPEAGKQEVTCGKRKFRTGDKVMQIKNYEDVNNGDIGYIRSIYKFGDESTNLY